MKVLSRVLLLLFTTIIRTISNKCSSEIIEYVQDELHLDHFIFVIFANMKKLTKNCLVQAVMTVIFFFFFFFVGKEIQNANYFKITTTFLSGMMYFLLHST